jgi:HJR/Mrr/RecB family endonuclease
MSDWDRLDPLEFERRCAATLTMLGWSAQTTKGSGDQGVDVVADKQSVRLVLQCKRYSTAVGVDAVQQVFAGQRFYDARFAAVVSNSSFTTGAKSLAAKCGVQLLHASELAHVNSLFLHEVSLFRRCVERLSLSGWKVLKCDGTGDDGFDILAERSGVRLMLICVGNSIVDENIIRSIDAKRVRQRAKYAGVVSDIRYTFELKLIARTHDVHLLRIGELAQMNSIFPLVEWPSFADCQKPAEATPTPPVEIQVPTVAADETPREDARSDTRMEFALSIVENALVVVALVSGSFLASKYLIGEAVIRFVQDASFAR